MLAISFFWLLVLVVKFGNTSDEPYGENLKPATEDGYETLNGNYYFPEFEAIASFLRPMIQRVDNPKCRMQMETYVKSLENSSLWAVQMFDASAKLPQGLLTSDAYDLGNFDGCVDINLKRNEKDNIFGKYCLVSWKIVNNEENDSSKEFIKTDMSVWETSMEQVLKYGAVNIRSGICVPNECTSRDVRSIYSSLYESMYRIYGKKVEVSVNENSCSTNEAPESEVASIVYQTIASIFVLVTTTTILDLLRWCNNPLLARTRILRTFSAYRNFKSLTSISSPDHIPVVDSLRVYAIILLVLIRRLSFLINGPILNRKDADQVFRQVSKSIFVNISHNLIVNTLLVLLGFLHCHKVYWYLRRNSKLSTFRVILGEYIKTMPLYMLSLLFCGYVFDSLGNGPLWKEKTRDVTQSCKTNFLFHMMHLNNFLKADKTCIFESWYFAVTAHCFVTVPIVVRMAMKSSTTGLTMVGLLTATAFVLPIGMNHFDPKPFCNSGNEIRPLLLDHELGTRTIDIALPYFVGVASSLIYTNIRDKRWKVSIAHVRIFSTLSATFCVLTLALPFLFSPQQPTTFQTSIINTSSHLLWSLCISWTIIGISSRKLSTLECILTYKGLCHISKLSFPYLLILGFIQLYTVGTIRTLDYFSIPRLIWLSACDLLTTYIFALVFYLLVQKPVGAMVNEVILRDDKIEDHSKKTKRLTKLSKATKKLQ